MRRSLLAGAVSACLLLAVSALSADRIVVSAKAQKQGMIGAGGNPTFPALGFDFSATAPMQGGVLTGQRSYGPIKLYRALDDASVRLFVALAGNEALDSVIITLMRPTAGGTEQPYYVVTLSKAYVCGLRYLSSAYSPGVPTAGWPAGAPAEVEEVSLVYSRIEIKALPSGAIGMDDVPATTGGALGPLRLAP